MRLSAHSAGLAGAGQPPPAGTVHMYSVFQTEQYFSLTQTSRQYFLTNEQRTSRPSRTVPMSISIYNLSKIFIIESEYEVTVHPWSPGALVSPAYSI